MSCACGWIRVKVLPHRLGFRELLERAEEKGSPPPVVRLCLARHVKLGNLASPKARRALTPEIGVNPPRSDWSRANKAGRQDTPLARSQPLLAAQASTQAGGYHSLRLCRIGMPNTTSLSTSHGARKRVAAPARPHGNASFRGSIRSIDSKRPQFPGREPGFDTRRPGFAENEMPRICHESAERDKPHDAKCL